MTSKVNGKPMINETNLVATNKTQNTRTEKKVFSGSFSGFENNVQLNNKPVKAHELDYSNFKKGDRADAARFAERSLNEVKDLARDFNSDFPDQPYIVNYSSFPRPEALESKNFGGKEEAYNAWQNAVTEWVEDCKQDMKTKRNTNLADLGSTLDMYMGEVNQKLDDGFYNLYLEAGVTREFIAKTYESLKGDVNAVNVALNKEAMRIRAEINASEANIINNNNINADALQKDVNDTLVEVRIQGGDTRKTVREDGEITRDAVRNEGVHTRTTVAGTSTRTMEEIKKTEEINALSDAISAAINNKEMGGLYKGPVKEAAIQKVENLKSDIINSQKIDHEKKVELLEKLRTLAIQDDFITRADLGKILEEVSTVAL